jgi:hypothetical protein
MKWKVKFWKWTLLFGMLGLLVPAVSCIHCFILGGNATGAELLLWPSSIMFMALDVPSPASTSTVAVVYAIAVVENVILYAVIGALAWLQTNFVFSLFSTRTKSLEGSSRG